MLNTASNESRLLASGASFVFASSDGSRVFFTSGGHYYQVEVESGNQTDLTPGSELQINGVVGHSEAGSYLYFDGVVGGKEGGYVLHEASPEWTTTPVPGMIGASNPAVSPDGRYLAFQSNDSVAGYDNTVATGTSCGYGKYGEPLPAPCSEVYLYDADAAKLACASCNPTGERPSGPSSLPGLTGEYELKAYDYQPRDLSNSGRVFFESEDALVPQDVDGTQDVYEYEPEGVGPETARCGPGLRSGSGVFKPARAFAGGEEAAGCISLISSGTSPKPSTFLDASESGADVFILTATKLSSQDLEGGFNVYDAHECTAASPCYVPPTSPPPCTTEASCKAAPTPQPSIYGAPSSATFSGAGNLVAPVPVVVKKVTKKTVKCKKGFVRNKKHKCVRSKSKKKAKKASRDRRTK